ncbi:hypothetical protein [Niallia oryzisoli]|uniref:hypothetical protein n=1 Tax=Niallia oryzisoli TaxID=1737571 RepID=UPI0037370B61
MDPKTKNNMINSMIGLAFVLLIFSFVEGKNTDSEKREKEEAQLQEDKGFFFTSPSPQDNTTKETKSTDSGDLQKIEPNEKLADVIEDGSKGEIVEIAELKDFFSEEDIKASNEVARQFSENYYPFDGGDPLSHIENVKEYMTTDLYEQVSKEVPRSTLTTFRKEVKSIELYEPYDVSSKEIMWMSRINGTVYNHAGEKTKDEVLEYRLIITKENEDKFKVKNAIITLTN